MRSFLNELIQQVEVLSMTEILTQILVPLCRRSTGR